ncbi:MAG: FAD-dependent monooxygenase [Mycobacterium sp.]|uniref:FAD-dependent monooxygenase n=1 Tax=Mycobacterium sp. TaxID=1785 RepID=UPI003BB0FF2B
MSIATNIEQASSSAEEVPVVVVGGGPVGLTLALTLAQYGVAAILVERNPSTTTHPKMDITNGRSMELFRHLGVADELRKVAVPEDHPFDVSWVTNLDGWELARFRYPTPDQRRAHIRECDDGTMALEPAMRVSQALLEPALKNILETRAPQIDIRFGWALETFAQDADGVDAVIRCSATGETRAIRAQFLAGCDGAGSIVRTGLGIGLDDIDLRRLAVRELGIGRLAPAAIRAYFADRERPMDGRIFLIHFTSPNRELFERFGTAWHTQSPEGWTLISQNDRDTWTLHALLGAGTDADAIDPKQFLFAKLGIEFDCDIICANAWRPRLSLADSYGSGRVWLAGDSAHQVVPAGGYGMNTGVGDAVGLGWMLAAIVQGWGDHRLLEAYEAERRPVAIRNRTASARHTLVRLAIKTAYRKAIHNEGWNGERRRRRLGREILDLGNLENEADGIEFGYRYDGSPIIRNEPPTATADHMHAYTPGTRPGARPPSLFLENGQAIFDLFGLGFTLLRFADLDVDSLAAAAADRGMPLKVVDIRDAHARRLYERDLVLIRPDHHVAWRGDTIPDQPEIILDRVRGAAATRTLPTPRPHLVDSTN